MGELKQEGGDECGPLGHSDSMCFGGSALKRGRAWDGWEDYLERRESMDLIKTARPQWRNLHVSDTGRLDEFFDHTGILQPI
jgi:hypothetical protein